MHVEDRGDAYLVVGSPSTDGRFFSSYKTHIFFAKANSEVLGISNDGRPLLFKADEAKWRRSMTRERYDKIVAGLSDWTRDGVNEIFRALYGGVVNKPADAVAYAKVLLKGSPRGAVLAQGLLTAVERDKVWHIARAPDRADILTFSRIDGKLLSPLP